MMEQIIYQQVPPTDTGLKLVNILSHQQRDTATMSCKNTTALLNFLLRRNLTYSILYLRRGRPKPHQQTSAKIMLAEQVARKQNASFRSQSRHNYQQIASLH